MKVEEDEKVDQEIEGKITPADRDESEQQRVDRPKSTSEIAKDLERAPARTRDGGVATALFPENESRDFHKR